MGLMLLLFEEIKLIASDLANRILTNDPHAIRPAGRLVFVGVVF